MPSLFFWFVLSFLTITNAYGVESCDWNKPGANRYTGTMYSAVADYPDIPAVIKMRILARMERFEYDDLAYITRDKIEGKYQYENLRDMYFGSSGKICKTVNRSMWTQDQKELALVYTEDRYTVIIPTVCGNVSQVTRVAPVIPFEWKEPEKENKKIIPFEIPKDSEVQYVSEPGTLYLVTLALIALYVWYQNRRK